VWKVTFNWTSPSLGTPQTFVFPDDVSDGPWTICSYGQTYTTFQLTFS
jgi:hypothetical protein